MSTNETNSISCSNHRTKLEHNSDITGIGITLSWTLTAGLALCLVISNYFVAYRPDVDPFDSQTTNTGSRAQSSFRPNPIDKQLLGWRLKKLRSTESAGDASRLRRDRIRDALTQCMLTMSDFQLITGLSVLISGYSQLPSGISIFHWERITDLAWFSSITHLCCLTFLRDHLYKNRRAQFWRISGMIVLIVLLSVALIPSALYVEVYEGLDKFHHYNSANDYTICFFRHSHEGVRGTYYDLKKEEIYAKKENTIISAVILIFGMTNRIWRLFETSTNIFLSVRRWFSRHIKYMLRWVLKATVSKSDIVMGLIYRPLLASYLLVHVLLDILLSKAFEVWWLTIGFFWGLTNLLPIHEPADQQWTFGQVIASLMLVAPVVALIETLTTSRSSLSSDTNRFHALTHTAVKYGQKDSNISPQNSITARPSLQDSPGPAYAPPTLPQCSREDPDYDFYSLSLSFNVALYVIVVFLAAMSLMILAFKAVGAGKMRPLEMLWAFENAPNLLLLVNFMACFLYSLSIDRHRPKAMSGRTVVGICSFILYASSIGGGFSVGLFEGVLPYAYAAFPFVVYLVLLIVEHVLTRRHASKATPLLVNHTNGSTTSLHSIPAASVSATDSTSDGHSSAPADGPSIRLPLIDTSFASRPPRRQDTEAEIGMASPRRTWTNDN
ncbi:hypothetical protein OPT61_g4560 [Boeremia exigua]|uniref:Uncharacterized protein n=1 Tax=Boeremia exigua TaxID=749465 RepID=A0ACC2IDN4_9PLEO|nr:hypothetical protein OPT61_g4560 [Boeremia exigua]